MKKIILILVVTAIAVLGGHLVYDYYYPPATMHMGSMNEMGDMHDMDGMHDMDSMMPMSHKDATYMIEDNSVTLMKGMSEMPAMPGSASKVTTSYFGNEAMGDLNGDKMPDVAFILTQNSGGSGTFYYVVVALETNMGYHGTNAILLGDRIAPQTTEIRDGGVIVNYAERKTGEPMTARPSVGVSKYLKVTGTTLEVVPIVENQ
ncbi:MAG: hypothetical protein V4467_05050 [Patescibacteria group bacterium]